MHLTFAPICPSQAGSRKTFSWLDWFRRLSRNYEESTEVAEEMIDLATIKILLNQIKQFLRGTNERDYELNLCVNKH